MPYYYTVLCKNGDVQHLGTFVSNDGIERVIAVAIRYCSVHGRNAAIGSEWEFAVIDDDIPSSTIAQTWVDSLELQGDEFKHGDYLYVLEGFRSPYDLPVYLSV